MGRMAGIAAWLVMLGCGPLDVGGAGDGTATSVGSTGPGGSSSGGGETFATTAVGTQDGGSTGLEPDGGSTDDGGTTMTASTGEAESGGTTTGSDGASSSSGSAITCDEMYGTAPDYILCMETDSECHFNATTNGSCNELCPMYGGACIEAFDNPNTAGQECEANPAAGDTCSTSRTTGLCVCSK